MARFILDFMINEEGEKREELIGKVLDLLERDELLSQGVTTINCIDETNDNQFWHKDSFFKEGVGHVTTSAMMNKISEKQIENYNNSLKKYD